MSLAPSFAIKTDVFEGPLELLLDLIEARKLLINDISLAQVTDEYMAHVREMQEHPVGQTAHFVLVASTLLLIKSKSLLPVLELTDEESASVESLEYRLKLYQIFRNSAKTITEIFGTQMLYEKTYLPDTTPLFLADKRTTLESLENAISDVIKKLPKKIFKPDVTAQKIMSLEDMIVQLQDRITQQFKFGFKEFTNSSSMERGDTIVSFLAVLELVKQGIVMVRQSAHFEDIEIERDTVDTPRYT